MTVEPIMPTPARGSEVGLDPVHHRAQLPTLALHLMIGLLLAHALEVLLARAILRDPFPCERPVLDLGEQLLHRRARGLADHALAPREIAVFGGVRDRVAHPGDALLIHE